MLRRTLMAMGLAAAMVMPQVAAAQTPSAPTEERAPVGKATVEVMVVHATSDEYVDPRLEKIMKNLKSTRFTGFKLLQSEATRLSVGGDSTVNIAGNRRLKVTLVEKSTSTAKVRIRMLNKDGDKVLDTTVSIPDGKYIMIAGPPYKEGKLVIPVGVTLR